MGLSISIPYGIDSISYIDDHLYKMIFRPPKLEESHIENLNNNSNVSLLNTKTNSGNTISMLMMKPRDEDADNNKKCILYSHGTAENIYTATEYVLKNLYIRFNINLLTYDYPGYGFTAGRATEDNCNESLKAVVEYAINQLGFDRKNIILLGYSLGTGVVIDYVSKNDWESPIILVSPYKSIARIKYDYPYIDSFMLKYGFRSIDKMKSIKCPVKIFHGEDDNIIYTNHGKELYDALPNKQITPTWVKKADHYNILEKVFENALGDVLEVIGICDRINRSLTDPILTITYEQEQIDQKIKNS